MSSRKLTFSQMAKIIGVPKALAAYLTRFQKFPSGNWSPMTLVVCLRELPVLSREQELVLANLERTQGNFSVWQSVHQYVTSSARRTDIEMKITMLAIENCIKAARTFSDWFALRNIVHGSLDVEVSSKRPEVYENLLRAVSTVSQALNLLHIEEFRSPPLVERIFRRIGKAKISQRKLRGLLLYKESRKGDIHSPCPLGQFLVRKLLPQCWHFEKAADAVLMLWISGHREAAEKLFRCMARQASSPKQWVKLKELTANAGPRDVHKKAVKKLQQLSRTFDDHYFLESSNRRQKISTLRRLARTFDQWRLVYRETQSFKDLRRIKEIATWEDWRELPASVHCSGTLLSVRNQQLAMRLK